MMQRKIQPRPKSGMKACLDLWYVVLLFSPLSLSLFHPHTYTWESRQLMCCLWWQREAYINSQKTMMKGLRKRKKWVENVLLKRMATHGKYLGSNDGNQTETRHRGVEGLMVKWQRRKGWGRRRAYRASSAVVVAQVGLLVPVCHAGGHPLRIRDVNTPATRPGFLLVMPRSGHQWTSHSRSIRHLCPVVVLDILSCVFIPPSFLWSCLPPLLSAVWHHHAAVSTSIKETSGLDCVSVGLCVWKGCKYGA